MLKFELFYDPDLSSIFDTVPQNKDVRDVLEHIDDFRKDGAPIEKRNTAKMSATDLEHAYIRAILPSVYRKYRVRQMFGSRRQAGLFFGRGVQALLITDTTNQTPGDIYPHEQADRVVTIHDFLSELRAQTTKLSRLIRHRADGNSSA
jgi:hypothetical protein